MEEDRLKKNGMHNKAHPIIFKNAARLRDNMTESERLLWKKLRLKPQGFKFRNKHVTNDIENVMLKINLELRAGCL